MLDIGGGDGIIATLAEENAESCLGLGTGSLDLGCIFLPLLTLDIDIDLGEALVFVHGVVLDKAYLEHRFAALRTTSPDGESVCGSFLHGNAEEAFVLKTCKFVAMT